MPRTYVSVLSRTATPQTLPIPGEVQVENNAGGFVYELTPWQRLDRFIILGSDGNTYYQTAQKLSKENADSVVKLVAEDGPRVVARVLEIASEGRAPKTSPGIFALAIAAAYGDLTTRHAVEAALPKVCRIGTHLFEFIEYYHEMKPTWNRQALRMIRRWYELKDPESLAYQVAKYQSRENWSHRDVLRLTHPKPTNATYDTIYQWIAGDPSKEAVQKMLRLVKTDDDYKTYLEGYRLGTSSRIASFPELRTIQGFEKIKTVKTPAEAASIIREYRLPRECVPSELLKSKEVWAALLDEMPMTALIRNLGTLSKIELLERKSDAEKLVLAQLGDSERLRKARVHPIAILSALRVYAQGHGMRSDATWKPVQSVVDALDAAFYTAFKFIEPTGKRFLLALDVSGSMSGGEIAGIPGLTPRGASAALALVTMNVESNVDVMGFTNEFSPLPMLKKSMRIDEAEKAISNLPFGGTDCSLPFTWAKKNKKEFDGVITYTDSETWGGQKHVSQAVRAYRKSVGNACRSVVVGMTSTGFTVNDPKDAFGLDVVGFDSATPSLISDFVKGA